MKWLFTLFLLGNALVQCYWVIRANEKEMFYLKSSAIIGTIVSTAFALNYPPGFI